MAHRVGLRMTGLASSASSGFSLGGLAKGAISTMPRTSVGAWAAATTADPVEKEWPITTAGPPRCWISAMMSAPTLAWAVAIPVGAGLSVATQVHRGDPVACLDQLGGQEPIR